VKKQLLVLAGGAVAASASVLFGSGLAAAAPDVVGQTYADAASAISDEGGKPVIASRVGDKLNEDECIVTAAWDGSFVRDTGGEFAGDEGEIMLALNCNGGYATATNPGTSVQHPLGREAKLADEEASSAEESTLEEVSTPNY